MNNVLYISYDGMTDSLGQSQVLPYIIGLIGKGYRFHLISFEKKNNFERLESKIQKICDHHNINWHPLKYTKRPPVLSTVFDLIKLKRTAFKIIKNENIDMLHCRSYLPSLIALQAKDKLSLPFVFDMRGFWADERVEGDIWNLNSMLFKKVYQYFKKKEKQFLEKSSHVVSLTHAGKREMINWGIRDLESKISVIPCASDFDLFELQTNESKQESRSLLLIPEKDFVISYLGSIGTWYLFKEMLSFVSQLKLLVKDFTFLILTNHDAEDIFDQAKEFGLKKEDFVIKFAERNEVSQFLDASDCSIFFIKPSYSKKSSSPTKMGEILAKGIPVIANDGVGDVSELISSNNFGWILSSFGENEAKRIIQDISYNQIPDKLEIRSRAKGIFDLNEAIDAYGRIYLNVLKS